MADPIQQVPPITITAPVGENTVPPVTAATEVPPASPVTHAEGADGVRILSTKAYKNIKDEATAKGVKKRDAELLAKAKELGFDSIEDMMLAAASAKKAPRPPAEAEVEVEEPDEEAPEVEAAPSKPKPPQNKNDRKAMEQYEREKKRWSKDMSEWQRKAAMSERKAKSLQQQLDAQSAEMQLREAAILAGVKKVDVAIFMLRKHVQQLDEEGLKVFDENKYFAGLNATDPYLFDEVRVPANTTTTVVATPATPKPGAVVRNGASNGQFDASKATPDEYRKRLKQYGLNEPQM